MIRTVEERSQHDFANHKMNLIGRKLSRNRPHWTRSTLLCFTCAHYKRTIHFHARIIQLLISEGSLKKQVHFWLKFKTDKMKTGLIPWFVLITATLDFAGSDDMDMSKSQRRASNDLVKRQDLKTKSSSCQGSPGLPGKDGRDGRDATLRGAPGPAGPPGPQGVSSSTGGVVYTRWGRKHCPATSKTLEMYSGVMGGAHYTNTGGGSNYLCLPLNPIYEKYVDGDQQAAHMHGVEYQPLGEQNKIFPDRNLDNDDAPCAVCHAKTRGSHMMIPARNICPAGWTMEYKGYLMAERFSHKRTQFICVDGDPEATHGSYKDTNGALLYFVEGYCGSALPCPPYVHGRELTCVVCTQ